MTIYLTCRDDKLQELGRKKFSTQKELATFVYYNLPKEYPTCTRLNISYSYSVSYYKKAFEMRKRSVRNQQHRRENEKKDIKHND